MAVSPVKPPSLTFKRLQAETFQPQKPISLSIFRQNPRHDSIKRAQLLARTHKNTSTQATSTINGSVSSTLTDLEKQKQLVDDEQKSDQLAHRWPEIHGACDWEGLLDPMDPLLRSELIRYGGMAQACYDAFDHDPYSKYSGSSKYSCSKFFQELDMAELGYDVTRFLYATSSINLPRFFLRAIWPDEDWSETANWIGYVAVSNDETSKRLGRRDITIAWRGTVTQLEWLNDLKDFLGTISSHTIPSPDPLVKVESGFISVYTTRNQSCRFCKYSARQQVLAEVKGLMEKYPNEDLSITITGHSLGSSLALLSAYDIAETGLNIRTYAKPAQICVFSFAGPRVGNFRFKGRLERLGVRVLRVVNVHDIVPTAPGIFINEHVPEFLMRLASVLPWSYTHVGVEVALDHHNSPFLKHENNLVHAHDLEAYLHLLDGYHGKGHKFELATGRDIALVNKYSDFLEDRYRIPPKWKQDENKGLLRGEDGRWAQPERRILDDHPGDMHLHLKQLDLSA